MKKISFLLLALLYLSSGYSQLQYNYEVSHVINNSDASIEVDVTNGSGAGNYNYTWYDNTLTSIGSNSPVLSGLNQGVYYLKVEDILNSNNYIYTYFWVGKYGAVTTLSIQPNTDFGNDLSLRKLTRPGYEYLATTNYGVYPYILLYNGSHGGYPNLGQALMKFEYNGLELATASTSDLTLYGWYYRNLHSSSTENNEVLIKRVKETVVWEENTTTHTSFGGSINAENLGGAEISLQGALGSTATAQYTKTVDISSIAHDHITKAYENKGMYFELKHNDKYRSQYFYSSDYLDDITKRPQLTISFTLPELRTHTYAKLRKKLSGNSYVLNNDQLYFQYEEEYTDRALTYKIWDQYHVDQNVNQNVAVVYGLNHLSIDCSAMASGTYVLEIEGAKGDQQFLQFKK